MVIINVSAQRQPEPGKSVLSWSPEVLCVCESEVAPPPVDLVTSELFVFVVAAQQSGVEPQEGVADPQGTVHRGRQQGEERKLLSPRRQREDKLAGDCHGNQPQQVGNLHGTEQRTLRPEKRVI